MRYGLKPMIFEKNVAEFDANLLGADGSVYGLSMGSR